MKNTKGLTSIGEQIYGILRLIRSPKAFPHLWQSDYNSLCVPIARTKRYACHRTPCTSYSKNCLKSSTQKDFFFRVHTNRHFSVRNILVKMIEIKPTNQCTKRHRFDDAFSMSKYDSISKFQFVYSRYLTKLKKEVKLKLTSKY